MSGAFRLVVVGLVAGAAGWAGLAAGERGITVATLTGHARMQIASWSGTEAPTPFPGDMKQAAPSVPPVLVMENCEIFFRQFDGSLLPEGGDFGADPS